MFNIFSTTIATTLATAWIPVNTSPTFRLIRFFLYDFPRFEPLPALPELGCPCTWVLFDAEDLVPDPDLDAAPFLVAAPLLEPAPLRLPVDLFAVLELVVLLRLPSPEEPVPAALRFLRC